jgi:hypothetical protein
MDGSPSFNRILFLQGSGTMAAQDQCGKAVFLFFYMKIYNDW